MKKSVKVLCLAGMLMGTLSIQAFAETIITNINMKAYADAEASMEGGTPVAPVFVTESDQYEIVSIEDPNEESTNFKSPRNYEVTLSAADGCAFASGGSVNVYCENAVGINSKKRDDEEGKTFIVKVRCYPYYKFMKPEVTSEEDPLDVGTKTLKFNKQGAAKIEYIIEYTDSYGTDHSVTGSTTSSSISLTSYNKAVSDRVKESDPERQDSVVTGYALRGIGNAGDNPNTVPSDWEYIGLDPENYDEFVLYDSWSDKFETSEGEASGGSSSLSGGPGKGLTRNNDDITLDAGKGPGYNQTLVQQAAANQQHTIVSNTYTWVQGEDGNTWYWQNGQGQNATGWIFDGSNWYMMGQDGKMLAGWFEDGDYWYYCNEQHDGTYGRMLTGWQDIGGQRYYFRPEAGAPMGSMVVGRAIIGNHTYSFRENGSYVGQLD